LRFLAGVGGVPALPQDDNAAHLVMTTEVGGHLLGGPLATGVSLSTVVDTDQHWSVFTPGLFAKLDLTYLFMTAFFLYDDIVYDPVLRLQLGGRLGVGFSDSTRPNQDVPYAPSYQLWRPELQSFVDLEYPLRNTAYALVLRSAVDTGVNLGTVYRYSFSFGLDYAWGKP
jgi:hypothetical protein